MRFDLLGNQENPSFSPRKNISLTILGLFLLALLLRLPGITNYLNGDEIPNFTWYSFIPWEQLFFKYSDPNQHTLFIALARLSMAIFGESEFTFRLPILIAGVLAVPLTFNMALLLLNSYSTALFSALLFCFSYHPIFYSQNGRSYSLNIFLGMTLIYGVIQLVQKQNLKLWNCLYPLIAFALILALPSNAYLIFSSVILYLILSFQMQRDKASFFSPCFEKRFIPFILGSASTLVYLLLIYSDLKQGVLLSYLYAEGAGKTISFSLQKVLWYCEYLVEPWGIWFLIFFFYGWFLLFRCRRHWTFTIIFFTPLILASISGIMGYERNYLYWSPFVFMISAVGLIDLYEKASKTFQLKRKLIFVLLMAVCFAIPALIKLKNYHYELSSKEEVSISEAKNVLEILNSNIPANNLIFLEKGQSILSHYIGQKVLENNFSNLKTGHVEGLSFIGLKNGSLKNFTVGKNLMAKNFNFSDHIFELKQTIGNVQISHYKGKIERVFPRPSQTDFESLLSFPSLPDFKIESSVSNKLLGKESLKFHKNTDDLIFAISPTKLPFQFRNQQKFVLLVNFQSYNQFSEPILLSKKNLGFPITGKAMHSNAVKGVPFLTNHFPYGFYLNHSNAIFNIKEGTLQRIEEQPFEFFHRNYNMIFTDRPQTAWTINTILYPVYLGDYDFYLGFDLRSKISTFDEIQIFVLSE